MATIIEMVKGSLDFRSIFGASDMDRKLRELREDNDRREARREKKS